MTYKDMLEARSMREMSDGGFILGGTRYIFTGTHDYYDPCLVRTNSRGTELWSSAYRLPGQTWGTWVDLTPDGGFLACGHTYNHDIYNTDVVLVKTDANGDVNLDLELP